MLTGDPYQQNSLLNKVITSTLNSSRAVLVVTNTGTNTRTVLVIFNVATS
jgi:hypothetical protein